MNSVPGAVGRLVLTWFPYQSKPTPFHRAAELGAEAYVPPGHALRHPFAGPGPASPDSVGEAAIPSFPIVLSVGDRAAYPSQSPFNPSNRWGKFPNDRAKASTGAQNWNRLRASPGAKKPCMTDR